jgi:hypothetical protein
MYDGNKIINLDHDHDEYGSVPNEFKVIDEFPIDYWTKVISHNAIVHFDVDPYIEEILTNLEKIQEETNLTAEIHKSHFTHENGTTYTVFFIYEESPGNDEETAERIREDLESHVFDAYDGLGYTDNLADMDEYGPWNTLFNSRFSSA